jgi:hypothetical protein
VDVELDAEADADIELGCIAGEVEEACPIADGGVSSASASFIAL